MTDILNTIDGALADCTSADAMRWSPEPEKVEVPTSVQLFGHARYVTVRIAIDTGPFAEAVRRLGKAMHRAMASYERATAALAELQRLDPDGPYVRRSAMRAAYRAKTRRRR